MSESLVHAVLAIAAAAIVAAIILLIVPPSRRPHQSLHPSGVGPHVYHPEVHEAVRQEFVDRAEYELQRREKEDVHPGFSGMFGSNYPPYSSCCS